MSKLVFTVTIEIDQEENESDQETRERLKRILKDNFDSVEIEKEEFVCEEP